MIKEKRLARTTPLLRMSRQDLYQTILDLEEVRAKLTNLLRHAAQRNHAGSPLSCTPCEEIEIILEKTQ